jgi:hypothetical protein
MDTINGTTPHYIRCIKPNDSKAAFEMENGCDFVCRLFSTFTCLS